MKHVTGALALGLLALNAATLCLADAPPKLPLAAQARVDSMKLENRVVSFTVMSELYPTRRIASAEVPHRFPVAHRQVGEIVYEFDGARRRFDDLFERNLSSALVVIKDGKLVYERYRPGMDEKTHHHSFSVAKSITATLVGLALGKGYIDSLDDPVTKYLPQLLGTGYEGTTIKHALQMSSGVKFNENYTAPDSDIATFSQKVLITNSLPALEMLKTYPRVAPSGTTFSYSTAETTLLTLVVAAAAHKPAGKVLEEELWTRIGAEHDAAWVLDGPRGAEVGGIGFNATSRDYAKIGQLMLDDGMWQGQRILPVGWAKRATTPDGKHVDYGNLPRGGKGEGYGFQWWLIPGDDGAYCAEGVFGQMIYVNPKLRLVVAKSSVWPTTWDQQLKNEAWTAFRTVGVALQKK